MNISIFLKENKGGYKEVVRTAKGVGVNRVQLFAGYDFPLDATPNEIKEIKNFFDDNGILITAACTDLGKGMFYENDVGFYETEKRAMNIAKELGANVFTTEIGVIPEVKNSIQYENLRAACETLGAYSESIGGCLAIRTGSEKASILKAFLKDISCKGLGVSFHPAGFTMSGTDEPVSALFELKDFIRLVCATDGIQVENFDPKAYYAPRYYAQNFCGWQVMEHKPLGEGNVDLMGYFDALSKIDYTGDIVVEHDLKNGTLQKEVEYVQRRIKGE